MDEQSGDRPRFTLFIHILSAEMKMLHRYDVSPSYAPHYSYLHHRFCLPCSPFFIKALQYSKFFIGCVLIPVFPGSG